MAAPDLILGHVILGQAIGEGCFATPSLPERAPEWLIR
jgi:hypothetical protein